MGLLIYILFCIPCALADLDIKEDETGRWANFTQLIEDTNIAVNEETDAVVADQKTGQNEDGRVLSEVAEKTSVEHAQETTEPCEDTQNDETAYESCIVTQDSTDKCEDICHGCNEDEEHPNSDECTRCDSCAVPDTGNHKGAQTTQTAAKNDESRRLAFGWRRRRRRRQGFFRRFVYYRCPRMYNWYKNARRQARRWYERNMDREQKNYRAKVTHAVGYIRSHRNVVRIYRLKIRVHLRRILYLKKQIGKSTRVANVRRGMIHSHWRKRDLNSRKKYYKSRRLCQTRRRRR